MMGVADMTPKKVEFGRVSAVNWTLSPLFSESVAVKEGTRSYALEKLALNARAPLGKWTLKGIPES
jgi:hypothetical protein